jgi:benzoyl-CoA reductase/2-hydroxyglutaryl-CoA dehydratase subunit BcrC/BadD/HgdB
MNFEFSKFIEQIEKLLTATEKYISGVVKELDEFCDSYFVSDSEIELYCKEKNIPSDQ